MTQQTTTDTGVVESSKEPDYSAITPASKPPTEYSYAERRSEILSQIEDLGHPAAINQTELAERYDVSQQQISKDLSHLDDYIRERLGCRRDLEVGTVFKKCMTGALEEGNYDAARRAAEAYDDYLSRRLSTLEFTARIENLEAKINEIGNK